MSEPANGQSKANSADANPKRSLFHYTTADGLIGILETQSLFATHYDLLNDSTEGRIILSVLLPLLERELREIVPKLVERKLFHPSILSDFGDGIYNARSRKHASRND